MTSVLDWYKKWFKDSSWPAQALALCWLAILLLCPLIVIESFHSHNPYGLGFGIGLTMFFYWATGIFTTLLKRWSLDE